jgi:hypothetical protein
MRAFLSQQRLFIVLLAAIIFWLALFPLWVRWVSTKPLDEAISLAPRSAITKEIQIVVPDNYELNLVFERPDIPFQQLKTLLGEAPYPNLKPAQLGVKVPVRWVVTNVLDGSIVASGKVDSSGSMGWSVPVVERRISRIWMTPGKYLFTAEILRDVPELAHIKTRLSMEIRQTQSSAWQIALAWWGTVISSFILLPTAIVIALVLLWRACLTFRSKRSAASGGPLR